MYDMKTYDFIAIGDTVTDDFISLKDAHVNCRVDNTACELCVRFGDKIPYEALLTVYAAGNASNAAVAAARLGLNVAFVSDVGGDDLGKRMLAHLDENKVDTSLIRIHKDKLSNHHFVLLYHVERTILIRHEEYDYDLPEFDPPKWIYFSSVRGESVPYHNEVAAYVKAHPETKLAFQPGIFEINLGTEALKDFYTAAHVFFCNREEAARILKVETTDVRSLSEGLAGLGPKIVCITDGPHGAYAYEAATGTLLKVPMYPDQNPPADRTGAGDAFSSTFTAMLAMGKSLEEALLRAPINSMAETQQIGSQTGLLSLEKLDEYLKAAPDDYKVDKVA
jgi:ribokinase